jgi:DNA-binding NarL/FixJ family response regulator
VRATQVKAWEIEAVMKKVSVVLIDDSVVARDAIANLIRQQAEFEVFVASAKLDEAVSTVKSAKARAILLEARQNGDGTRLTTALRSVQPDARIIVTGIRPHQDGIMGLVGAGASGFIMKDATLEECLESIRVVIAGGHALPRRLAGSLFREIGKMTGRGVQPSVVRSWALTNRERQVLTLIGDGLGNKEVASRLHISGDTVRSHVASLFKKLHVRTRLQLATFARADAERHAPVTHGQP